MSSRRAETGRFHGSPTRIFGEIYTVLGVSWLTDPDEEWSPEPPQAAPPAGQYAPPPPGQYVPAPAGQYVPPPAGQYVPAPAEQYAEPPRSDVGFERTGFHAFEDYGDDVEKEPRGRLRIVALLMGAWLIVSLVVLGLLLTFQGPTHSKGTTGATGTSSSSQPPASASQSAVPTLVLPDGWVQVAADDQTDCAAHSYGEVASFLAKTPCTAVHRVLATTNQGGRTAVVAYYVVTFPSASKAQQFNSLVTSDGTGDINDLLREGARFQGAPSKLPEAAFVSRQDGAHVYVSEAGYVSGKSDSNDATLKSVASQAIAPH